MSTDAPPDGSSPDAGTRGRGSARTVDWNTLLQAAALLAITVAAYWPATRCGFIWDDETYVENNPTLRSADGLRRIWFEIGATPQYYPLVHTTYWLEYRLWRLNPAGYHAVNILLHAIGAVLFWRVLTFLRLPGAWAAAALFALHPVHAESVAWITERKNVLCGVFYLGSVLAYLRWSCGGRGGSNTGVLYGASLLMFLLAMLSKTVACTLPAALLLILWWKGSGLRRRDLLALAPFVAIGIVLGLLTVSLETTRVGAAGAEWNLSSVERFLLAGRALWFYAGKLLVPVELIFVYPRWKIDAAVWWQYGYPLAATALAAALWFARGRIGRGPFVAAAFFAVTLFPALGFFDVYPFRYSFVADHFQYLASLGPIALFAGAVMYRRGQAGRGSIAVVRVVMALLLAVLGYLTWHRTQAYFDLPTLWKDTLRRNPACWMAHNNLGTLYAAQGRIDVAIEQIHEALRLYPDYPEAHYNLGRALGIQGRLDESIREYRRALALAPDFGDAHNNLGIALQSRGEMDSAIKQYRAALRIRPDFADARNNLGTALRASGRLEEALAQFRQCAATQPENALAHYNLAWTLAMLNRVGEADPHFQEAARLKPDWPAPLKSLAWILATHPNPAVRDGDRAVRLAQQAAELTENRDPDVLDTLAAAWASAGDFDRAVSTAEAARILAQQTGANALADRINSRIERYRRKEPFIEANGERDLSSE